MKSWLPALIRLVVLALLVAFVVSPQSFARVFAPLTKPGQPPIYTQNDLLSLTLNHLAIVAVATIASTIVAVRPFRTAAEPWPRFTRQVRSDLPSPDPEPAEHRAVCQ